jgi:hypothetical protein
LTKENNGQRRRSARDAEKPLGKIVAWNEGTPRSVVRRFLNTFVTCEDCGDRMLYKNLPAHIHKALKHQKPKAKRKKKDE